MDKYTLSRQSNIQQQKYVDLKINGKLFPTWVLANFKKYKLPPVIRGTEDPCAKTKDGNISYKLKKYQEFISEYLNYNSRYRDILIYHGLGSGKTATAINIYNVLYNYTPEWNVFIMIKASLKGGWLDELKKWLGKDDYDFRFKNIHFIHYDSPFADRNFMEAVKSVDSSKKSLYIVDEVHNFIRNVYSNIESKVGRRALVIYEHMIREKKDNLDTRVVLLSGTPIVNKPFELSLLFNLLRPDIFPNSESEFNNTFVTSGTYKTATNINMFQRRILGLVSFYIGSTPDVFASKAVHYVDVPMSKYQEEIYSHFESIEEKMAKKQKSLDKKGKQSYKSYTRQACNFVFPAISQDVTGEGRPRPNKFRISERDAEKFSEGELKLEKGTESFLNLSKYTKALQLYKNSLIDYLKREEDKDSKDKYTISNDVDIFKKKYNGNYREFHDNEKRKSNLYQAMHKCSAKMVNIIFNTLASPGPVLIYSNYVNMEGLEILKVYLSFFNFYSFMETKTLQSGRLGYVEFHGGIKTVEERYDGMRAFNKTSNMYGEQIKIIMISPAGSEGLSLKNVRQVHIMEPYWNEVRIVQMIGRAVRQCSHSDLKMEDRHVDVYRYRSVRDSVNQNVKWTTDQQIEDIARSKESIIQAFLGVMKEAAIDCVLNKAHNSLDQDYRCFQFEEQTMFNKFIGPAYKQDMKDDMLISSGSNSVNSKIVRIKVYEITAVKQLSDYEEGKEITYSKPDKYWYYSESSVVYDHELHYPVGKVAVDGDGNPVKLNEDTYIIDRVIPIPVVNE